MPKAFELRASDGSFAAGEADAWERGTAMPLRPPIPQFIEYPKCSTCKKAKVWLDAHGIEYTDRHIVEDNPTAAELADWHERSGLPLRRFFNTSGMKYRELGVKDKLDAGMTDEEAYDLLATDGMLVKRPLFVTRKTVLTGFREAAWEEALL